MFRMFKTNRAHDEALAIARGAIQNLSIPAFFLDERGVVIAWNDGCARLTGLAAADVLGTDDHWKGFYPSKRPCLADVVLAGTDAAYANIKLDRAKGAGHAENWCDLPAGGRRYLAIDAALVRDARGRVRGVIETLRDLTAEQEAMARIAAQEESSRETDRQQQAVVTSLAVALGALAEGDLAIALNERFPDAYEPLRNNFNRAVSQLGDAIARLHESSRAVADSADNMLEDSASLARRAEHQAAMLEQTSAAQQQIAAAVERTLKLSEASAPVVEGAKASAAESRDAVNEAVQAINRIEDSARNIGQVTTLIDEIAFQTNLLALNAGIEAARAGEAGRGFAVVAQEVRALAQRSAKAAKEIKEMVATSGADITHGVRLVTTTGVQLNGIFDQIADVSDRFREIGKGSEEQATALREVAVALRELDNVTQQNAGIAERNASACEALTSEAAEMATLVQSFRVPGGAAPSRAQLQAA